MNITFIKCKNKNCNFANMLEKPLVKKKRLDYSPIDSGGKLPPQAQDFEEAILGAIMLEKDALRDAIETLKGKHFYNENHQLIFDSMLDLYNENQPVDILTVTEKLKTKGSLELVGGPYFIAKLTSKVSSAANIQYHAHIVIQKFIQRELIRIAGKTMTEAFDEGTDAFKLLDETEKELYEVKNDGMKRSYKEISSIINDAIAIIESNQDKKDGLTGIPSGIRTLDDITSGWQKSDLIILAARPGMGKTAIALTMLRNAAVMFNKPVAFFSLEMSSAQLVTRLISGESEIPSESLKRGNLAEHEWAQLHTKIQKLSKAPIFIDDTPALSLFEFKAKCRRLHSKHNIEMVMVDYLQLMRGEDTGKNGNREQEIGSISRGLKALAKELNIPIIALAQLSRDVEKRGGDKKPQLSDLRESGSIEQDADIVAFVHRYSYYKGSEEAMQDESLSEVIIRKHRNGQPGEAKMHFLSHIGKFISFEENVGYGSDFGESQTITYKSRINTNHDESTPNNDMRKYGETLLKEEDAPNFDTHIEEDYENPFEI